MPPPTSRHDYRSTATGIIMRAASWPSARPHAYGAAKMIEGASAIFYAAGSGDARHFGRRRLFRRRDIAE